MTSSIISPLPLVWNHDSELWLAPSLEEAKQASANLAGVPVENGWENEPLDEQALSELNEFCDEYGNEQTGLEAYQDRLANGATVEPFGVIE